MIQFLTHRGFKIYSAACLQQIGDGFRRRVASFAEANDNPAVTLNAAGRTIEVFFQRWLARLARNGLITRRPHASTYDLIPDGLAFAIFYTKVHDRVLTPLFAAGQPQAPPPLRAALTTIQRHIDDRLAAARLPMAA